MDKRIIKTVVYAPAVMAAVAGLWIISRHNYLLFHSLAELFSIAVAGAMFAVAWNSRRFSTNGYLTYVGIAYLSVAGLDLVHTLAFKGLGVFPAYGANLPTQLWIASRGMEALSLLIAPVFLSRHVRPWPTLLSYLAVTTVLLVLIFPLDAFPTCYVEGEPHPGLTPFKIGAEYIICLVLLASITGLWAERRRFSPDVLALITAAIGTSILSELAFTRYLSVYGDFNMVGHLLKVISFLLLYKATVEATLKNPYKVLFRDLNQQEEALRESHERFRVLAEATFEGIAFTEAGRIVEVNDQLVRMLGYSKDELIGEEVSSVIFPEDRPRVSKNIREGRESIVEHRFVGKDGVVITVEAHGKPFTYDGRNIRVTALHDITERKRAEEALRLSEEKFAVAFANNPAAIAMTRLEDGLFLEVNDTWVALNGYSREEVIGHYARAMHIWPTTEASTRFVHQLQEKGSVRGREQEFLKKSGEVFVAQLSAQILTLGDEKVILSTLVDITERKRAEEAVQRSREELEQRVLERTEALRRQAGLLELAYNAIIVRDLDGRVTFWNARAEELYGFTRDEALGEVTHALLQTQFRVSFEEHMTDLTTEGQWEGELTHTRKDGRQIVVLSRQALQRDEEGRPVAIMEINLDITEQRHMEEQLRQAQKMEALGTLSGGIAHDFNNILAAIIGFTELVEGHVDKDSRDARHLERVMQASLRGRELVRQMLTFSRKAEHEKKPLRMSSIVNETVKLIRASTPSTVVIGAVDTVTESGLIFGDPTQIQQVLMNLCTNAIHAMREKGGTLDIQLSNHSVSPSNGDLHKMKPGLYVKLTVRDTGTGIAPDIMDKIFDPFFTTKKLGEGTGLGLSVVHGIVKQHDGYITAMSESGKGCTFTVYLPKITGASETDVVSDDMLPTGSERVLFVDDEEALTEMGEGILAELGYEVTSRMNGREALTLFRLDPSRFDLIITDQTMPELTGVDLAKEILSIRADMPIIMCTGFSHMIDADGARAAGIKAFAMKPLTKGEIARTIRQVLDE